MSEIACEKLQQLVFDENKIVSFKLLTKLLKIDINSAKKYLQNFFDSNQHELNAYYVVIGLQKNENKQFTKIVFVPAAELEKVRKSFVSISSCHIYCIHKGELVDKLALFSDNGTKISSSELSKFSIVKNPNIHIQSPKKFTTSPQKASTSQPRCKLFQEKGTEVKKEDKEKIAHQGDVTSTKSETKPTKKDEAKGSAKSKGANIFSMFQKQASKKPNEEKVDQKKPTADSSSKTNEEKIKNQSPKTEDNKTDIKQLFSKQREKRSPVQSNEIESSTSNNISSNSINHTTSSKKQNSSQKRKNNRVSSSQNKKKESDSDEELRPKKKKHRRIVEVDDSDSESENEESLDKAQREIAECEPDPCVEMAEIQDDEDECIPPTQKSASGKVKKWKDVVKTFEDENGFFVTKRTKEYVTASEESENEDSTKIKQVEKPKEVVVNKATFANKKQASLTSFFKK